MRSIFAFAVTVAIASAACAVGQPAREEPSISSAQQALTRPEGQVEHWDNVSSPQVRGYHGMAYDEGRGESVVFGGSNESGLSSGTWVWNGSWVQRFPALSPSPRTAPMMTYDSDRKRVILFGGQTSFSLSDETWSWDGTNWTLLSPATKPSPRHSGAMAYDPVHKTSVLFTGLTGSDETWTFDGTNWKKEATTTRPPLNRWTSMAFDYARQTLVMAVQAPGVGCPVELWKWSGSNWSLWTVSGGVPSLCTFSAAFDRTQNSLVLTGLAYPGNVPSYRTWSFDGTAWTETVPSKPLRARQGHTSVFDSKRGELLSFGGFLATSYTAIRELVRRSGTSLSVDPGTAPPFRAFTAAALGPNGSIVTFGGIGSNSQYSNETWLLDAQGWRAASTVTSPTARYYAQMAFDERRNQTVLLNGRDNSLVFNDTWTWDGSEWTKRTPAIAPPFGDGTMSYDSVRERVWYFELGVDPIRTWSWDGQDWLRIDLGPAPPRRYGASVAFDRARGVTVVFGGQSDSGVTDDTWTWDGATWTALAPQDRPAARMNASLAWDDVRKQLVLFGGQTQTAAVNDVWRWDGQNWSSLIDTTASILPAERTHAVFLPIGKSGNFSLFGGFGAPGVMDDQWVFRTRGGTCKSGSECGSGSCVDGACCERQACGTCETCGGNDRGICESIRNAEDPDTCATKSGKRCNADGRCLGGAGATCAGTSDCSTGFCVDGVCCSTSCELPCEACSAAAKQIASDDGRCGPAKVGTNPGNRCSGTDTCSASGVCEARREASCISGSVLDLGDGTSQNCAPYTCKTGGCTKTCSSYLDCTFPASCSAEGRCEVKRDVADDSGCGVGTKRDATAPSAATLLLAAMVVGTRKRGRRASQNR
ncbi:MAG: kelch repeat-containing protein [Polyangiaceae bacterium]